MDPLVSILIPAYNAEAWIADTIQSALSQTWRRKEIIIVDDGSEDATLTVAGRFESEEVKVISQAHAGAAAARNRAYALSHGDFIQWLDADDLLDTNKISEQMKATKLGMGQFMLFSGPWGHFIYRPKRAKFKQTAVWCDLDPVEWLLRALGDNCWMQPASWLVSRELSERAGPWDTRLSLDDDGEYFCRVILASKRVRFIPKSRTFYRQSAGSLSSMDNTNKKLDSQFLSIALQIEHLRRVEDSDRVRRACLQSLQRYVLYFYPERRDLLRRADEIASQLGGTLDMPRLPWKYAWLRGVIGWSGAKRVQSFYNRRKFSLIRACDKALFDLEQWRMPGLRN